MTQHPTIKSPSKAAVSFLAVVFALLFTHGSWAGQSLKNPAAVKSFAEAKAKLQSGVNDWDAALMMEARDLVLGCLVQEKTEGVYLPYYVALADYSLAIFHLAGENAAECDTWVADGEAYLDKAMSAAPEFGDALALYAYFLGLELANHPDRAMTLGMKSFEYFDRAFAADGSNPRAYLLRGTYQLYVPEQFGGGPDSALEYLDRAIELFETEKVTNPLLPSWGRDEALTTAALAHKQKGNTAKAVELLKRALAVNPRSGRARGELAAIEK
jgi:tetratricopeptide (TPR) repeat protein